MIALLPAAGACLAIAEATEDALGRADAGRPLATIAIVSAPSTALPLAPQSSRRAAMTP